MSKCAEEIRRLEQLVREMESVPDPALKMRVAELVAELADLRWVLTRRAEAAGVDPRSGCVREDAPEHDGPVLDHYGCRWLPAVRPGDGFRGWVHHLPGPNLPSVWLTGWQLTIQRGPLTAIPNERSD